MSRKQEIIIVIVLLLFIAGCAHQGLKIREEKESVLALNMVEDDFYQAMDRERVLAESVRRKIKEVYAW